jgi:CheY-specific phosphatase CheX
MEKALFQAAALTFEELGFLFPNSELEQEQKTATADAMVEVEFSGPFEGKLMVKVCGNLLPTLTLNMLGENLPPPLALQHDALGEIANVICGNALPLIAGKKEVFRLKSPQLIASANTQSMPNAAVQLGLDQGRAEVMIFINGKGE